MKPRIDTSVLVSAFPVRLSLIRVLDLHQAASDGKVPGPVAPLREMGKRGGRAASRRLKIGVIGFGKFGQFIAKTFVKDHDVVGMGRGDYTIPAKEMGA